jgi:uncharacterized protein DUF4145
MIREIWTRRMTKTVCPRWPCPTCGEGHLTLVRNSLNFKENEDSQACHTHPEWEPDWIENTFTAWAKCRNPSCEESFALAGSGSVAFIQTGPDDWATQEYFQPLICHPMPRMIEFPRKCPKEVRERLEEAFKLFWIDKAACAGRIRVALQELMNILGIQNRKKASNGKLVDLSLLGRIEIFAKKNHDLGIQLMALKWLGNTGSHSHAVDSKDLLDAMEIMEHALMEIIEKRREKVAKLAKGLQKRHRR